MRLSVVTRWKSELSADRSGVIEFCWRWSRVGHLLQ